MNTVSPLALSSTTLTTFGVGACPELVEGLVLRPNSDSKNPFFLGVGVTVTTTGVGDTFVSLKASSLSERFTRDPNTNKNTSTTIRPRTNDVTLLKPLMVVL